MRIRMLTHLKFALTAAILFLAFNVSFADTVDITNSTITIRYSGFRANCDFNKLQRLTSDLAFLEPELGVVYENYKMFNGLTDERSRYLEVGWGKHYGSSPKYKLEWYVSFCMMKLKLPNRSFQNKTTEPSGTSSTGNQNFYIYDVKEEVYEFKMDTRLVGLKSGLSAFSLNTKNIRLRAGFAFSLFRSTDMNYTIYHRYREGEEGYYPGGFLTSASPAFANYTTEITHRKTYDSGLNLFSVECPISFEIFLNRNHNSSGFCIFIDQSLGYTTMFWKYGHMNSMFRSTGIGIRLYAE